MEREVIAKRNTDSAILDFVIAFIGACLLAYTLYLACTSEELASIVMGAVVAAVCAAILCYFLSEAILIMRSPEEIIVKLGEQIIINGKSYALPEISVAELKMHKGRGGQFAFGNIGITLKKGGKTVCRGVADAQNAYKRFCSIIYGAPSKKAAKGNKNG